MVLHIWNFPGRLEKHHCVLPGHALKVKTLLFFLWAGMNNSISHLNWSSQHEEINKVNLFCGFEGERQIWEWHENSKGQLFIDVFAEYAYCIFENWWDWIHMNRNKREGFYGPSAIWRFDWKALTRADPRRMVKLIYFYSHLSYVPSLVYLFFSFTASHQL